MREAAQLWTEAYPQTGVPARPDLDRPVGPGRLGLRPAAPGPRATTSCATGAESSTMTLDPVADLVRVQLLASRIAERRGLDPDRPRHLTRSVVLGTAGVILCLCPSPAIDITYRVAELGVGATNRVTDVAHRPGGKAVNVARVLHALGTDVVLVAALGGASGAQFRTALADLGLAVDVATARDADPQHRHRRGRSRRPGDVLCEPARVDCWPEVADRASPRAFRRPTPWW